jgi:hypothetical protein
MSCDWTLPTTCVSPALGGAASAAVPAAWDAVCKSFVDAASALLRAFGGAFTKIPDLSLGSAGIGSPYGISLVIGSVVAALLIFGQVMRTLWTRDGTGMAEALAGTAKAVLAWLLTVAVAAAALGASDELTRFIVTASFGSQQGLADKLGSVVNWSGLQAIQPLQAFTGSAILLVVGMIGIVLVIVLWFELLLRNAALAVLIAVSPIAAAGQVSEATKAWWSRTVAATGQLIILNPVIALVFAVGFGMAGQSAGLTAVLQGLLVLGLAVFAWPVIARFFTFTSVQAASAGLSAALGLAAGVMAGRAGGGPAGVPPDQLGITTEGRVMGARGGAAAGAGGGGTGGAVLGAAAFILQKAHQAGSALAGRMEQTAGHAGMPGAYPYSTISAGQRLVPGRPGTQAPGSAMPPPAGGGPGSGDGEAGA